MVISVIVHHDWWCSPPPVCVFCLINYICTHIHKTQVALDGAGNKGDVRVEEGYLVNATINARGELEGRLAPAFNRYGRRGARVVWRDRGEAFLNQPTLPCPEPPKHTFMYPHPPHRIPPGRYVNVAYVLSAPTQAALALSNFTVTAAEVC